MKAALALLAFAAAGCQVNVDNSTQAKIDNAESSIEGAAESAGNVAEAAAGTVENAADKIGNGVDVDVNLHGDGNDSATANRQ